jgi:hypothetical protein
MSPYILFFKSRITFQIAYVVDSASMYWRRPILPLDLDSIWRYMFHIGDDLHNIFYHVGLGVIAGFSQEMPKKCHCSKCMLSYALTFPQILRSPQVDQIFDSEL